MNEFISVSEDLMRLLIPGIALLCLIVMILIIRVGRRIWWNISRRKQLGEKLIQLYEKENQKDASAENQ